jgi:hypothetical protein
MIDFCQGIGTARTDRHKQQNRNHSERNALFCAPPDK